MFHVSWKNIHAFLVRNVMERNIRKLDTNMFLWQKDTLNQRHVLVSMNIITEVASQMIHVKTSLLRLWETGLHQYETHSYSFELLYYLFLLLFVGTRQLYRSSKARFPPVKLTVSVRCVGACVLRDWWRLCCFRKRFTLTVKYSDDAHIGGIRGGENNRCPVERNDHKFGNSSTWYGAIKVYILMISSHITLYGDSFKMSHKYRAGS